MIKTLAFIHTSPVLVPTFAQLAGELLPEVSVFHMVDESLIKNTIKAGHLTKLTARRVLSLIESAEQAGAEAVMVTCSSIGQAVTQSRHFIDVPVLRIDEAMAEAAVAKGTRIGVAATLRTTLDPTLELLQATARQGDKSIETVPCLCEGAFDAVINGQPDRHDSLVKDALQKLMKTVDVVVLAQASMASAASVVDVDVPVLTSLKSGVKRLRELVETLPTRD
jgi:Asp/Glu/hydantoin racemase